MKKKWQVKLAMPLLCILSFIFAISLAYADDGDIYNDGFWRETKDGLIRPISIGTGGMMRPVEIFTTGDTLATNDSGKICILNRSQGVATQYTFTLPPATVGTYLTLVSNNNEYVSFNPNATELIKYLTLASGDRLVSAGSTGDSVSLVCAIEGQWTVVEMKGSWTDGDG